MPRKEKERFFSLAFSNNQNEQTNTFLYMPLSVRSLFCSTCKLAIFNQVDMISSEALQQLKQIPITDYLQTLGHNPVKQSGKEWIYYSPYNQESTPSFMVDPIKNVFHDHSGEGEKGDIIRLVQYINGCSFVDAVKIIQQLDGNNINVTFSFRGQATQEKPSAIQIVGVQPLRNRALLAYVESRRISIELAVSYLQEIHYRVKEKQYYAVGFGNDKGGYELRSQYFKGSTSPKWFTSITGQATGIINVFEGVFDFLTCCEQFSVTKLKNPSIVLNSLSFINDAIPVLASHKMVNAFMDNDKAGKRALERLEKEVLTVQDCSQYYPNSKDFNAYWVKGYSQQ